VLAAANKPPPGEVARTAAPGTVPARWWLMKEVQGTWLGAALDDNRLYLTGWSAMSFTGSTAAVTNEPQSWNDRANRFLVQQEWIRFGRTIVTSGTTSPSLGFQADIVAGSDYRFSLPRGLLNGQLQNATGTQNLYGVDLVQHYVSLYVPTLFAGTEFRAGRVYTPWGMESLEAVSSPMLSKSYVFNFSPFTNCGAGAYITFNPAWSAVLLAVNGNDVYFGSPAAEWRFAGNVKWTQPGGGRNTVTLATSFGSGRFNPNAPNPAATVALANEPFGRNNFNAFDLVWTHAFDPRLSYNLEAYYGYQYNVPGASLPNRDPNGFFFTNWVGAAHYLIYAITPQVSTVLRYGNFDDFQGQRTGFAGLYTELTTGMQFKFRNNAIVVRPELRIDYNGESRPFEGRHYLFTAASDMIIRW
jgi:hypothetical protein